jgi:plastocyanin
VLRVGQPNEEGGRSGAEPFNSGNVNPGETFEQTFTVAGDYAYSCMLHRSMAGAITVQG